MALFLLSTAPVRCFQLPGKAPGTLLKRPSPPFSLLPEKSSSVRRSANHNIPVHCQHSSPAVARPETDFHPAVWDDYFIQSNPGSQEANKGRIGELKENVRNMLIQTNDPLQKMILVDSIDNLGIAYHFDEEIKMILEQINNTVVVGDNLLAVALRFKLLRQQGYHVSSDVFEKFRDAEGKFNRSLKNDARGLLSLYEASHHSLPGEDILDDALTFTTTQLKSISSELHPALAKLVKASLALPLQRSMLRLQARTYITFYEEDEARKDDLLELAKLDFNHVQTLHQAEIKESLRWWKELGLIEAFSFARDRVVESYMWGMDESYLPQFSLGRITIGKHVTLLPLADEMYDVYGTLEELELLTDAIDRWDLSWAMDQLPSYMKPFYIAVHNFVHETYYMSQENHEDGVNYLKKIWANYCKGMMQDTRWSRSGHIPTVEEYLNVKERTTFGYGIFLVAALGMGDMLTKEALDYVGGFPKIRGIVNRISRMFNDLATLEFEEERGIINSVTCYMKEHGVSKEEARLGIKSLIAKKWKELNQEVLQPLPLPRELINALINFGRVNATFYQDGQDGYSDSISWMKDHINNFFIKPIPI